MSTSTPPSLIPLIHKLHRLRIGIFMLLIGFITWNVVTEITQFHWAWSLYMLPLMLFILPFYKGVLLPTSTSNELLIHKPHAIYLKALQWVLIILHVYLLTALVNLSSAWMQPTSTHMRMFACNLVMLSCLYLAILFYLAPFKRHYKHYVRPKKSIS